MAQERGTPTGYDWEDPSVPTEPEPLALPGPERGSLPAQPLSEPSAAEEHGAAGALSQATAPSSAFDDGGPYGAPSFSYDADDEAGDGSSSRRAGALPPWAIVAIVAVQAMALVVTVSLVVGGLQRLTSDESAPPAATATEEETATDPAQPAQQDREPGTVTDAAGREVADGTGLYDDPATIGDHTFTWPTWTDGTLSVTAQEVDLEATLPGADGRDVAQAGYRLVSVAFEVRYEGPGQLAPVEELWLSGESDRAYFPDVSEGLVPDPMSGIGPLQSGRSAQFHSLFVVPEDEIATFRLGVETFNGEALYFATA